MEQASSRRAALIAVTMISFASPFMLSGVNIALPTIGQEFSATAVTLTWVTTIYGLATAILLLPCGKLADIYGRKRLFLLGAGVYAVSSTLCALAPSAPFLLAARVLQGFGAAMNSSTGTAILTSVYPSNERGRVLGINTAAVYLGLSAGPFLGGMIVQALGWRAVFWLNVPLALLTVAFTLSRVHGEWADAPNDRLDVRGSLIYAASVVALIVGFGRIPSLYAIPIILTGAIGATVFIRRQDRHPSPVLDLSIFRGNRVFSMSSLAALVNYAATASITYLLSLYLQYIQGLTPGRAGLVLVAQPIVQAIFSPIAGRLSDRVQARYVASAGMGFTVIGLSMLAALSERTTLPYVIGALLVLGFGFALFSSPNVSALMGAVPRRHYGVASGLVATMRTFGQMVAMAMLMVLFTVNMGSARITPEVYPAFLTSARTAYSISAALCTLGIFASLARGRNVLAATPAAPETPATEDQH